MFHVAALVDGVRQLQELAKTNRLVADRDLVVVHPPILLPCHRCAVLMTAKGSPCSVADQRVLPWSRREAEVSISGADSGSTRCLGAAELPRVVPVGDVNHCPVQVQRPWGGLSQVARRAVLEAVLVVGLLVLYRFARTFADGDVHDALTNAREVLHIERALHLPSELGLQDTLLDFDWLVKAANVYYAWVHFPATGLFLAWTYGWRQPRYPAMRNWMALVIVGATVGHILFPLAPPRMMDSFGFIDTAAVYGPAVYSTPDVQSIANQYAAMPSLHVAWAVIVAWGLVAMTSGRWRWLWLVHPTITIIVVVGTANHYWLDAIIALGLLVVTLPLVLAIESHRHPSRLALPRHELDSASQAVSRPWDYVSLEDGQGAPRTERETANSESDEAGTLPAQARDGAVSASDVSRSSAGVWSSTIVVSSKGSSPARTRSTRSRSTPPVQ